LSLRLPRRGPAGFGLRQVHPLAVPTTPGRKANHAGIMRFLNSPRSIVHWATFAGLISIALLLRVSGFQGYSDSDPRDYAILANDLAHGTLQLPSYDGPPVFPLRLGVYGPVAIIVKAFGLSELTLVVYPFLLSIAGLFLAYALARILYGPLAGLLAIGLLAALPTDVSMASRLYPDAIAAFWDNVAVLLTYLGLTKTRPYHCSAYALLAGLLFGISWLCKESVAYLVPFVGILVLCLHREAPLRIRLVCLISLGIGSMAVLSAEVLSCHAIAGDPWFHYHAAERNYQATAVWFFDQSSPYFGWENGHFAKALAKRLIVDGPREILLSFRALPAFAALALAWRVVFREYRCAMPGIWLVSLALMFCYASSSFEHYRPLPTFERYLYPLLLPAALLFAGFLARLLLSGPDCPACRERAFWAWALIAAYFAHSASALPAVLWSRPERTEREVAAKVDGTDIIYTDYRTASSLVFFRAGSLSPSTATTIPYENMDAEAMEAGAYVLLDNDMTDFLVRSYDYRPPPFVHAPPQTWRRVWADGMSILFQIPRTLGGQGSQADR